MPIWLRVAECAEKMTTLPRAESTTYRNASSSENAESIGAPPFSDPATALTRCTLPVLAISYDDSVPLAVFETKPNFESRVSEIQQVAICVSGTAPLMTESMSFVVRSYDESELEVASV